MEEVDRQLLENQAKPFSVLETKRIHAGKITVRGTIVSYTDMYIVAVPGKGVINHRDAKTIKIEDTENLEANERLDVVLYDDMILDVRAGEVIEIFGEIRIEHKNGNNKNKRLTNVLHTESIKYLNRKELIITENDIKSFHAFAKYPNLIQRMTSMFAPNIKGHDDAKLGILRSVVGGVQRGKIRGRINTLLVGDPGTAKSTLIKEAVEVKANSRYVSGPHSSAKTITAIMDKENDGLVLRLGAIPLSRGAICAINEVTAFPQEEQARLLDVLEEGEIPLNKHGKHQIIPSPTSILATANPFQSKWSDSQKVSNDEILLLRTLLDRMDQIYPFRDNMNIEQIDEFVNHMSTVRKRRIHNYNYLKKYLQYVSAIEPVITPEA